MNMCSLTLDVDRLIPRWIVEVRNQPATRSHAAEIDTHSELPAGELGEVLSVVVHWDSLST